MKMVDIKKARITRKNETRTLLARGISVKRIASMLKLGLSTVYTYKNEIENETIYQELESLLREAINEGLDIEKTIRDMDYNQICILARNVKTFGYDKESRIEYLVKYFSIYAKLGLYPSTNYTKDDIKRAFKRMAKKTHPDLNKKLSKCGKEFKEVKNAYDYIMSSHIYPYNFGGL